MTQPSDPGKGPPPGLDPFGQSIPMNQVQPAIDKLVGANGSPVRNDPAFQNPSDPLSRSDAERRAVELIYRDIPLISISTDWTPPGIRAGLNQHVLGYFEQSGQIADSVLGDARVQATLNSRLTGLFGRPVIHKPANDSRAARECFDAWVDHWPTLASSSFFREAHSYGIMMGWSDSQIWWDTSGKLFLPFPKFWHPRYEYYHWPARTYVALTQDGQQPVTGGDGKWVHHTPKGDYRGWIYGAIRAIAEPWLLRHYAFTYMARFSERHGMPIFKAYAPFASDKLQREAWRSAMANVGSETTVLIARGETPQSSYELELLEAQSTTWEVFPGLIDRCDMDITLALLFQNLTTEVQGGSFAAVRGHMDVRAGGIEDDNAGWRSTLKQISRPFALFNFGDAALAPTTEWDVQQVDRANERADLLVKLSTAVKSMKDAGVTFAEADAVRQLAKTYGIDLPAMVLSPLSTASTVTASDPNNPPAEPAKKPQL